MKSCKFHPSISAVRTCANCDANYCDTCCDESPLQRSRGGAHACFGCGQTLAPLKQVQSDIVPFWRRLPEIYRYPLGFSALAVITASALLSALLASSGVFKALPSIVITLYSFSCLRETAKGALTAPGVDTLFDGSNKPIGSLVALLICVGVLVLLAFKFFGVGAATMIIVFFVVTMPAAILVIAIEEDFVDALNPAKLMSVVIATGTSYFVMLIFLLIMISSVALLVSLFQESEPTFGGVFFQSLIGNYYNVAEFHILGYLVHQNRYKLGFDNVGYNHDASARSPKERNNAKLEFLIKSGNYPAAVVEAKRQVNDEVSEMWKWSRCFKLMCIGPKYGELKAFLPQYFDKLEQSGQINEMADAYMAAKKKIRDLAIDDNQRCLDVAHRLFTLKRYNYVIDMLQSYYKRDAEPDQINQALQLVSASYLKVPGREKNAQFFQNLYELKNSPQH